MRLIAKTLPVAAWRRRTARSARTCSKELGLLQQGQGYFLSRVKAT
jgi:hypothetical protein